MTKFIRAKFIFIMQNGHKLLKNGSFCICIMATIPLSLFIMQNDQIFMGQIYFYHAKWPQAL